MKLVRYLAVLFMLVIVTGCSSDSASINPAKLVNFKSSAQFDVRWRYQVGTSGSNCLQRDKSFCWKPAKSYKGTDILTPAITAESVISANEKNEILCFDLLTGKFRWKIKNRFDISGGVGSGSGAVLVGGDKGDVALYEESTGKLRWVSKVSSEVLSAPKVSDGVVVVRSEDGRITGLDAKDGKRLWLYERATPALVARGNSGLTIRNGIIYAGFAAGKLTAIGLHNGVTVWESSVSQPHGNTELERISDIISLPILDDSQVCAVSFQGRLGCYEADRGGALWSRDISSDKGLTISRKYLFLSDVGDTVLGLDKLSGSSYWKNDQLANRRVSAPLAIEDYLIVADFEGYLHALNRDDGSFVARMRTDGSAIRSTPVAAGEGFVVQTGNGSLYYITIH
jgi:outer membrane protein assembly factor BamB